MSAFAFVRNILLAFIPAVVLGLALGARAESGLVRQGAAQAAVTPTSAATE